MPSDDYFRRAYERLPHGLQALIAQGIASGLIIQLGHARAAPADRRAVPHGEVLRQALIGRRRARAGFTSG